MVVDVRSADEYARGHLPGAIHVPVDQIPWRGAELPAGQVLTVCSTGNRAWRAAQALASTGRTALCLTGGTTAWTAAGLPLVTGQDAGSRTAPGRLRRWRTALRRRRSG
ncbi:MAG TPA: rhodanese-like domain-containing protein [Mycobacteriales bacterium]